MSVEIKLHMYRPGHPSAPVRYEILDALRGILALTVVLGHLGMPPVFGAVDQSEPILNGLARLWRTFAFGPPAVIAFFIISGFCIHYPFIERRTKMWVGRFYLRRYIRITIPIAAVVATILLVRSDVVLIGENSILWRSTLWSVLCEEIYYACYPLLLFARRRIGMLPILLSSLTASIAVILFTFPTVDWSELGVIGTSVVLLPVWLLGAVLAERASSLAPRTRKVASRSIVIWRIAAWGVMWLALVMHFHIGLHQTASGIFVGFFAFLWLRAEIAGAARPSRWFIGFGAWSYSLYLVHPVVILYASEIGIDAQAAVADWALTMGMILILSYLFYLMIEAPSHALARKISLRPREA